MAILKKLLFVMLMASSFPLSAQEKPNIIYIYADDLGYGSIGPYGNKVIMTPNIDQMAKDGMLFTQHYTGAPVCAPARGMLLTGKHAGHSYIRGNYELGEFDDAHEGGQMPLPEGTYTLPKMLKKVGYVTGAFGKWGLGMPNNSGNPNKQGFDYFYGVMDQKQSHNYYPTHLWRNDQWDTLNNKTAFVHKSLDSVTAKDEDFQQYVGKEYGPAKMLEEALHFIDKNKNKPFFIYFSTPLPHASLQVPEEYINMYKGKFDEPKYYYGQMGYAPVKYPYSSFAGMITYLDMQVGELMKKLKEAGLEKKTIIMLSSDNGGSLESGVPNDLFHINGPLRGFKRDLYEGGIREPFMVKWPGKVKAGVKSDLISTQYDLMATLGELTGADAGNTDGISFLPTLLGQGNRQKKHAYLYWEFGEAGGAVAVRMGKWKGIKTGMEKNPNAPWQLYDLNVDIGEKNDVAADHKNIVEQMEKIVKQEHENAHIREWEFINPKFKK